MRSCGAAAGSLICDFKETHDGGLTWSWIPIVYDPDGYSTLIPGEVRACNICGDVIYIDPQRLIVVSGNLAQYADEQIRLQITTNWGEDWQILSLPLPSGQYARSWIRPHSPEFYSDGVGILPVDLMTEDGNQTAAAFYGSSDGGLSWTFLSLVEIESGNAGSYLVRSSLVIVSDEDIFLRCGEDLCVTHDGVHSWQRLSSNLNFGDSEADNYAGWLDFGDAMTGWTFVETNEDERTLWRTTDGGLSWQELTPEIIGPE